MRRFECTIVWSRPFLAVDASCNSNTCTRLVRTLTHARALCGTSVHGQVRLHVCTRTHTHLEACTRGRPLLPRSCLPAAHMHTRAARMPLTPPPSSFPLPFAGPAGRQLSRPRPQLPGHRGPASGPNPQHLKSHKCLTTPEQAPRQQVQGMGIRWVAGVHICCVHVCACWVAGVHVCACCVHVCACHPKKEHRAGSPTWYLCA